MSWTRPDIIDETLARHTVFAKAFLERPESLARFLPYDEYLDRHGLFLCQDGSLGAAYEVTLCEHETKTSTEILDLVSRLGNWFRFDERSVVQILFDQSSEVAPNHAGARGDIPDRLLSKRLDQLGLPFRRRLLLCVKQLPMGHSGAKERLFPQMRCKSPTPPSSTELF